VGHSGRGAGSSLLSLIGIGKFVEVAMLRGARVRYVTAATGLSSSEKSEARRKGKR
jgi:hypothetical protein